jgi:hypothetical protein
LAMWHIIQSDSQQRKLALAAISTLPTKLKLAPAIERLEWARIRADKLGEYRNLLAHNPVVFRARQGQQTRTLIEYVAEFGSHSTGPKHRKRLQQMKGLPFWQTLRTDLLHLSNYVDAVNRCIQRIACEAKNVELVSAPKSWPSRPRLRSASNRHDGSDIVQGNSRSNAS